MKYDDIMQDASYFDPRTFEKLKNSKFVFPEGSISKIASMAKVEVLDIQCQLLEFAQNYEVVAGIDNETMTNQVLSDELFYNESSYIEDDDLKCALSDNDRCKSCLSCAFLSVFTLMTHTSNYNALFTVYKVILSLAFTQVSCERTFSVLKTIKTKLRSTLSDEMLEAFMFMNLERSMVIHHDVIIDRLAATSTEMKKVTY